MPDDISRHFPKEQIGRIVGHPILQKSGAEIARWLQGESQVEIEHKEIRKFYLPDPPTIEELEAARKQREALQARKEERIKKARVKAAEQAVRTEQAQKERDEISKRNSEIIRYTRNHPELNQVQIASHFEVTRTVVSIAWCKAREKGEDFGRPLTEKLNVPTNK